MAFLSITAFITCMVCTKVVSPGICCVYSFLITLTSPTDKKFPMAILAYHFDHNLWGLVSKLEI